MSTRTAHAPRWREVAKGVYFLIHEGGVAKKALISELDASDELDKSIGLTQQGGGQAALR